MNSTLREEIESYFPFAGRPLEGRVTVMVDDLVALIQRKQLEARIDENLKLAKQCDHVAKEFNATIQKQKTTLESIVYYARDRIAELNKDLKEK